jgi:hypothetical protein
MNINYKVILTLLIGAVLVGILSLLDLQTHDQALMTGEPKGTSTATSSADCMQFGIYAGCIPLSEWSVYKNQYYGYQVSYPPEPEGNAISEIEMDSTARHMLFGIPGKYTLGSVEVNPEILAGTTTSAQNLSLREYTTFVRVLQQEDKNPYMKGRLVGSMEESVVAGRAAYQFTLTEGFSYGETGGYGIPKGLVYNYVVTESPSGEKFIISYLLGNEVAKKWFDSFEWK